MAYAEATVILVLFIILSYLLGAVPFGYLFGKMNGIDLREHGSCNIGATNAMRVLGKSWGISVFVFDFLKGFAPVWLWHSYGSQWVGCDWWYMIGLVFVGLATILGHVFTCFLRFKGGKGVATGCGVIFALAWQIGVVAVLVWLLVLVLTRYVSVASMVGSIAMIFAAMWKYDFFGATGWTWRPSWAVVIFLVIVAMLVILKHHANISRIIGGTEHKAFSKKNEKPE